MGKRILVVEDDVRLCEVFREVLAAEGYEVGVAHDGESALAALDTQGPDLLVVDINLPGLGGASLVRRLRSDPALSRWAGLPVIVVSALWDIVSFDLDIQGGFAKPVPFTELCARVRELLGPA